MSALAIPNGDARRLWLWSNGLTGAPGGKPDVMGIIRALGFVQIDTIRNVTRAHHHILWSRNPSPTARGCCGRCCASATCSSTSPTTPP